MKTIIKFFTERQSALQEHVFGNYGLQLNPRKMVATLDAHTSVSVTKICTFLVIVGIIEDLLKNLQRSRSACTLKQPSRYISRIETKRKKLSNC